MEPMDLDSDGDSSLRQNEISDMEIVSSSPVVDQNVKEISSFEKLECALSSILSFDKSPTKSSGPTQSSAMENSNMECPEHSSYPSTRNLNRGFGISEDDDYISQFSATQNRSDSNDGFRKRSKITLPNPTKISNQKKERNIAKSKARSLIVKNSDPNVPNSEPIKQSNCLTLFLKCCTFCIFSFFVVFCILLVFNYFQRQCNTGENFSKRVLEMDLDSNVFGQHIAVNIIPSKLETYLQKFHLIANPQLECKPLVLSFHGWTGVGKNYVSKIISVTLYHSNWNYFIIPYHFPHEAFQSLYRTQIKTWIVNNVTECNINVVVIDEMDKAYPEIVEGIADSIIALTKPCHKSVPTIFLLLSNSFAVDINREFLSFMRASHQNSREQFAFQDVHSISEENVDSWFTYLSHKNLIDAFVPFLPLEKKHVIQCIKRELVSKRFSTDSRSIDNILKELSFSVFGELELSNTGCKRVADKVDLIMLDDN
uniref:Torsin-1A C-terminal domain-containing protein n=1 Tax=Biomphalaria glabrata TaxID=6526 RepID=A0A2C9JJF6_BIOGL